ncbi:putative pentatricopeptide repeat-containing protein At1g12700, mitochondrial [Salvia miltiorrhiza]|uniref:putative pentatricopeptide repeat-containing protein At1g12700, mitochondrial n=1 Tax=Salvia miltiorrhiza TaxID=226208 RepID=UPI0025ABD19D|nr:putative pentatricopeptide repeat-containing protein At1g12700, mitochondrial [Salvia miltiorrhiza]
MSRNHAAMILGRIISNSSFNSSTLPIASLHSFLVKPRFNFDNLTHQIRYFYAKPRFNLDNLSHQIRSFSSYPRFNLDNLTHQIRYFSAYHRFDFESIREPNDAVALFRDLMRTEPLPSVKLFSKLLSAVVKMRQYSLALHLIDEMLQRDVPVDHYILSIAIDCYCRLKKPDFGFAILGIFLKRGYEPTVVTFTILIKGLLLVGRIPEAAKVLWKLSVYRLCEPDEQTYNTMINGICKAVGSLHALELLCLLEKEKGICKPDVYSYTAVIDRLCKEGKVDDALQLFSSLGDCYNSGAISSWAEATTRR